MLNLLSLAAESIARLESTATIREKRLTDPEFRAWEHFRRKLGWSEFLELVLEDAGLLFPHPFSWLLEVAFANGRAISDAEAEKLLRSVTARVGTREEALPFLSRAARDLNVPAGGRFSALPRIQAWEKVLELPGASGRAAVSVVRQWPDVSFGHFTFLVESDADRLLAGLAAVEAGSREISMLTRDELLKRGAAGSRFDRVIGLSENRPKDLLVDELATGGVLWV